MQSLSEKNFVHNKTIDKPGNYSLEVDCSNHLKNSKVKLSTQLAVVEPLKNMTDLKITFNPMVVKVNKSTNVILTFKSASYMSCDFRAESLKLQFGKDFNELKAMRSKTDENVYTLPGVIIDAPGEHPLQVICSNYFGIINVTADIIAQFPIVNFSYHIFNKTLCLGYSLNVTWTVSQGDPIYIVIETTSGKIQKFYQNLTSGNLTVPQHLIKIPGLTTLNIKLWNNVSSFTYSEVVSYSGPLESANFTVDSPIHIGNGLLPASKVLELKATSSSNLDGYQAQFSINNNLTEIKKPKFGWDFVKSGISTVKMYLIGCTNFTLSKNLTIVHPVENFSVYHKENAIFNHSLEIYVAVPDCSECMEIIIDNKIVHSFYGWMNCTDFEKQSSSGLYECNKRNSTTLTYTHTFLQLGKHTVLVRASNKVMKLDKLSTVFVGPGTCDKPLINPGM